MEFNLHHFLRLIFSLLLITTFSRFTTNAEILRSEIDSATFALRSVGYTLFGNSISASDLLYQILAGDSFTLLAPPDTSLFSLDMSTDAFSYIHSLRYHIIPHRHISYSDFHNISLSKFPYLETLVPNHFLFVSTRRTKITIYGGNLGDVSEAVLVDGVRLVVPDVYIGPNIVVHGLDGTLDAGVTSSDSFGGGELVLPPIWTPERHPPLHTPSPAFVSELSAPSSSPIAAFAPLFGQMSPYTVSPFPFHFPSISIPPAISPPDISIDSRPPHTSLPIWHTPSTDFVPDFSSPLASPRIWSMPPELSGGFSPWNHDYQENDGHGNATPQNAPSFSPWNHDYQENDGHGNATPQNAPSFSPWNHDYQENDGHGNATPQNAPSFSPWNPDHEENDGHGNATPQNAPSFVPQHHATVIPPSAWNVPPETYEISSPWIPQSKPITWLTPPPPVQWKVPPMMKIPPPPGGESTGTGWQYVRKRPKKKHGRKRHQRKQTGHKAHAKSSGGVSSNTNGEV